MLRKRQIHVELETGEMMPQLRQFLIFCVLFASSLLVVGCSAPTETARENRRLLDAILTAITMKNQKWLSDDAEIAKTRHEARQLTDWEFEQLSKIIDKGSAGEWKTAEELGYEFRKAHPFVKEGR